MELTRAEAIRVQAFGLNRPEPTLADRVDARLRAEWPGHHTTAMRGLFEVPEIREGGATDALLKLAHEIIEQESGVSA